MSAAEFYRLEADRLLSMARSLQFGDVGDQLTQIAERYKHLAAQAATLDRNAAAKEAEAD